MGATAVSLRTFVYWVKFLMISYSGDTHVDGITIQDFSIIACSIICTFYFLIKFCTPNLYTHLLSKYKYLLKPLAYYTLRSKISPSGISFKSEQNNIRTNCSKTLKVRSCFQKLPVIIKSLILSIYVVPFSLVYISRTSYYSQHSN